MTEGELGAEVIHRINRLKLSLHAMSRVVTGMNATITVPLKSLAQQTAAARARVQELEFKLVKDNYKMELENRNCSVKTETQDVKVKMEKNNDD